MSDKCMDYPIKDNVTLLKVSDARPPFDINTTIPYKCNSGYIPIDASYVAQGKKPVFTCKLLNNSALWQMDTGCKPVSCGHPGYVENAKRSGHQFVFPEKVTFKCYEGYRMVGIDSRFCGVDGQWTPSLERIKCVPKEINCPPPGPFPNVIISPKQKTYMFKNIIMYHCPITNQSSTAICKENSKWSNPPPPCEIKKPVLLKTKQPMKAKKTDLQNSIPYLICSIILIIIAIIIIINSAS